VVLHRDNLDHVHEIIALAERLAADRLELANTQYLGWALLNRRALLPTREQLDRARRAAAEAKRRLKGRMEVLFVLPDYYSEFPKACMDGWGRRFLLLSPDGLALPCHVAHTLPGVEWANVRDRPLSEIWHRSPGFELFRGEAWMPEPCRSCDRRALDFGGRRCQAVHLTGNAGAPDPGFLLAGLLDVLLPQRVLVSWLGGEHLGRGILIGWAAGLAMPGGPYVFFPVAANLFRNGAAAGPLITLLTAKTLVSPVRTLTY